MKQSHKSVITAAMCWSAVCILSLPAHLQAADAPDALSVPSAVASLLRKHCVECHGATAAEADVRLDAFASLSRAEGLGLLSKVQEQLYFGQMPPEGQAPLTDSDKSQIASWIKAELAKDGQDAAFAQRIQGPKYGNYVDHDKLFSGAFKDLKGFTYDRTWLISEFIFREKMNALLRINESARTNVDGKGRVVTGLSLDLKIANPFLLPAGSGVRYYANAKVESGHLMAMIGNSKHVSETMITYLSGKYPVFLPAVKAITETHLKNNEILASRSAYLRSHIDRLCEELYKNENEAWLPSYSIVPFKDVSGKELMFTGERAQIQFNAFRNTVEGELVEKALFRYGSATKDTNQLIRMCEKYWFAVGVPRDKIEHLVEKMQVNIEDFQKRSAAERDKRSQAWKGNQSKMEAGELEVVSATIRKLRTKGMTYQALQDACMAHWTKELEAELEKHHALQGELPTNIVRQLYDKLFERQPAQNELDENVALLLSYSAKIGVLGAITKMTQTLLLKSEFINRHEYGVGKADQWGRRMMSPRDASYAIAYALTDLSPDAELAEAARSGRLNTREDYKREVERLLKDRSRISIIDNIIQNEGGANNATDQPIRKVRFFREFFGYRDALNVFKDQTRFGYTIEGARETLIAEADMLVEHILEVDKDVFKELLTTEKYYIYHNGDNEEVAALSEQLSNACDYFQKNNWRDFKSPKDLEQHVEFLTTKGVPGLKLSAKPAKPAEPAKPADAGKTEKPTKPGKGKKESNEGVGSGVDDGEVIDRGTFQLFINIMSDFEKRFENGKYDHITPYSNTRDTFFGPRRQLTYRGIKPVLDCENVTHFYNIDPDHWNYPPVQPAKIEHRKGMLTHPAWLQAFSQNARTDPVTRGKWIREKLLAGSVPETPVTVEAKIPDDETKGDHKKTVRTRLASVTEAEYCWRCHQSMNPLGYPFECFDDFGRYRTEEELEHPDHVVGKKEVKKINVKTHPLQTINNGGVKQGSRLFYKTLPVDTTGVLSGTGDRALDGKVKDAFDLIDRLAQSTKVRQSIIRYAFRYFMGRNEMLSDSKTLMDADEAYLKSGGSFDAVIVSLLTSDSFIYRKEVQE